MTEGPIAVIEPDSHDEGRLCGAKTRPGAKYPTCHQRAGHRTDHPGSGRCRLHGGSSRITTGRRSRSSSRYHVVDRPRIRELYEEFEQDPDPLNILPELWMGRSIFTDFIERYDEWREAFLAWHASYSEKYMPISEENRLAFVACLDEWEDGLLGAGLTLTAQQASNLAAAREYVKRIANPILLNAPKPREVLDVSAAMQHAEAITKMVERIEKIRAANAISRPDLIRIMVQMGNALERHVRDIVRDDEVAGKALAAIRSDWLSLAVS